MSYSFVRDKGGAICGLWLQDSTLASNRTRISMLLLKEEENGLAEVALADNYRIVPNNYNQQGGVFNMFNSALAPGENIQND